MKYLSLSDESLLSSSSLLAVMCLQHKEISVRVLSARQEVAVLYVCGCKVLIPHLRHGSVVPLMVHLQNLRAVLT